MYGGKIAPATGVILPLYIAILRIKTICQNPNKKIKIKNILPYKYFYQSIYYVP